MIINPFKAKVEVTDLLRSSHVTKNISINEKTYIIKEILI